MIKITQEKNKKRPDDEIIKEVTTLFETEKCYCESAEIETVFGWKFIVYEFNGDRGKTFLIKH